MPQTASRPCFMDSLFEKKGGRGGIFFPHLYLGVFVMHAAQKLSWALSVLYGYLKQKAVSPVRYSAMGAEMCVSPVAYTSVGENLYTSGLSKERDSHQKALALMNTAIHVEVLSTYSVPSHVPQRVNHLRKDELTGTLTLFWLFV